jgi:hypothetical protein
VREEAFAGYYTLLVHALGAAIAAAECGPAPTGFGRAED